MNILTVSTVLLATLWTPEQHSKFVTTCSDSFATRFTSSTQTIAYCQCFASAFTALGSYEEFLATPDFFIDVAANLNFVNICFTFAKAN